MLGVGLSALGQASAELPYAGGKVGSAENPGGAAGLRYANLC